MSTVAGIVFQYDGDSSTEETVHDLDALDSKLKPGAIIERKGRLWKVVQVEVDRSADEPDQTPLWRVQLSSSC